MDTYCHGDQDTLPLSFSLELDVVCSVEGNIDLAPDYSCVSKNIAGLRQTQI